MKFVFYMHFKKYLKCRRISGIEIPFEYDGKYSYNKKKYSYNDRTYS